MKIILLVFILTFTAYSSEHYIDFIEDCCSGPNSYTLKSSVKVIKQVTFRGSSCDIEVEKYPYNKCNAGVSVTTWNAYGSDTSMDTTQCGNYYITERAKRYINNTYTCVCNAPDKNPEPPLSNWVLVGTESCDGVLQGIETNLTRSSMYNCCAETQYYAVKEEVLSCPSDKPYMFDFVSPPSQIEVNTCEEALKIGDDSGQPQGDGTITSVLTLREPREEPYYGGEDVNIYGVCCYSTKSSDSSSDSNSSDSSSDSNSSDSSSDSNSSDSSSDSNSSNSNTDLSSLEDKLDKLNEDNNLNADKNHEDLGSLGDKLDKINEDNKINADNIKESIEGASSVAHGDAKSIKDAIENSSKKNSELLEDIKDILSQDANGSSEDENTSGFTREELDKGNETFSKYIDNSIKTYTEGFNSISESLGLIESPMIDYSGSCELSVFAFGQNASLSDTLKELLPIFKSVLLLSLNISLALMLLKLTVIVFWDIFTRMSVTF